MIEPVWIGCEVTIGAGVVVGPYCVIGDRVELEDNCRIAKTVVWDGAHISAEVENSIVGSAVHVPPGVHHNKIILAEGRRIEIYDHPQR